MKEVLFIHSAGPQGHYEGSDFLVNYLRKKLGDDYEVVCPEMPDPENPHYDEWCEKLAEEFSSFNEDIMVVGHSLGGSVLLKYLSESARDKSISGVFIIAAPYWGEPEWEVDEYVLENNFPSKLPRTLQVFLYHCKDDEVVPVNHLERYAE